jgi:hypothetical protein
MIQECNMDQPKTRLPDHVALQRPVLAALAKDGAIREAEFIAGDYADGHGMVLVVRFVAKLTADDREGRKARVGVLYKQDDLPRVFTTPVSIMSNAHKLGIHNYRVAAEAWKANYYDVYKAQVKAHSARLERQSI